MKTELLYLVYVTVFTALLWVPYILDRIATRGLLDAVGYPESPKPQSPWALRLLKAHLNAVENLVDGSFFNSGQSCCGIERIYVDKKIYPEFIERFVALTRDYVLGNPLDETTTLGPVIKPAAAEFVRGQIAEAVSMGAKAFDEFRIDFLVHIDAFDAAAALSGIEETAIHQILDRVGKIGVSTNISGIFSAELQTDA